MPRPLPAFTVIVAALLPLGALAAPQKADDSGTASLTVDVTGLHSAKGQLIACLWTEKRGFPSCSKSKTARRLVLPVTAKAMQLTFANVSPGQYAVTVHHDENADGKMQSNFIGMPKEGVGISNNPGGMPGFTKSLITVGPHSEITVRMKYLFE